jgi:hypothetical protein
MSPDLTPRRTAMYFGLRVEVLSEIEQYALIRFCCGNLVVETKDLLADPEMVLEQRIHACSPSHANPIRDCQRARAACQS